MSLEYVPGSPYAGGAGSIGAFVQYSSFIFPFPFYFHQVKSRVDANVWT